MPPYLLTLFVTLIRPNPCKGLALEPEEGLLEIKRPSLFLIFSWWLFLQCIAPIQQLLTALFSIQHMQLVLQHMLMLQHHKLVLRIYQNSSKHIITSCVILRICLNILTYHHPLTQEPQIHQLKHQMEQYHDQQFIWVFRYRIYSE